MKNLFKFSCAALAAAVVFLTPRAAQAQGSTPNLQSIGGIPVNYGYMWNTGPLQRLLNPAPIVVGAPSPAMELYTNNSGFPAQAAFLMVNLVVTNGGQMMITNFTTGDVKFVGNVAPLTVAGGTNDFLVTLRLGASDVIGFTNTVAGVGILNAEWRN